MLQELRGGDHRGLALAGDDSPMDVPSWVSASAAVVSFLFAAWSWWWSTLSRKARSAADEAKTNAEQARDTAVKQVVTLTRLAETLEGQAANRDSWALALNSGSQYRLTNISGADAVDVRLDGPKMLKPDRFDLIGNRSGDVFLATNGRTVTITWTPDLPGSVERSVRLPLPPRG